MMMIRKATMTSIAAASILAVASSASANTTKTEAVIGPSINHAAGGLSLPGHYTPGHIDDYYLGSSSTATFFYKKGVRNFEKGNLDKAEQAFEAVLRANGTNALDKLTLHYLSYINKTQGDAFEAKKHAQAYLKLK